MKPIKRISFLFLIAISFVLNSCSNEPIDPAIDPSANNSSSSGIYKWSFKLDGVLYEWSGNHITNPNSDGQSTYSGSAIALQQINSNRTPIITVAMNFPSVSTGDFVFSSSASQGFSITFLTDTQQMQSMYSVAAGGTMNVNISSLSANTLYANPTNPGKVIGTFSGTIKKLVGGNSTATITEGTFEAIRGQ
ncbi:hypothetical protein [Flavobacterium sp.]|jgi:hypothetical protein|uniref:hypothetical protein n=1 Tax=Flavobacterium sp. TaxID=239 RepID=UPI0037C138F4